MAKYKADEVVRGLDIPFPTDNFIVRITKMEKRRSAAGNNMVVTDIEIVDPAYVTAPGGKVQTAGQTARLFGMLDPSSPYGLSKLLGALARAGLPPQEIQGLEDGEVFDDEPEALNAYVGKTFSMTLACKSRVAMRTPTPEERAAGKKAEPLLDANGKEICTGYQIDADWSNVTGPAADLGEGW